jgi:Domain of unknown function (DUF4149)
LLVAILFGGMVLYSFGFAAFIFHALPPEVAGPTIRRAFPYFYLFVIGSAAISSILISPFDLISAAFLALIAITTLPTRQLLMPAINRATDRADRASFKLLHGLSVAITLSHIFMSGWVLLRFIKI